MRARFPHLGDDAAAFVAWEGAPLSAAGLPDYLGRLRAVRINMEFNGALCRGLKQARYREKPKDDDDLTIVDFIDAERPCPALAPPSPEGEGLFPRERDSRRRRRGEGSLPRLTLVLIRTTTQPRAEAMETPCQRSCFTTRRRAARWRAAWRASPPPSSRRSAPRA